MEIDSIGLVIRDLIRQILAFAFPGSLLVACAVHVLVGFDTFREFSDGLLVAVIPMGYGASVGVGFALHCLAIPLCYSRGKLSHEAYWSAIGSREAEFQTVATAQARYHHGRLTGYWQMCSSLVLATVLGGVLLVVEYTAGPTIRLVTLVLMTGLLLGGLAFGHCYMQTLVDAYERRVIEGPPTGARSGSDAAAPEFVEQLEFNVPADRREAWLEADERVWTQYLQRQPGFVAKEVWVSDGEPQTTLAVIWWKSRQDWARISDEAIKVIDEQMGETYAPPSLRTMTIKSRAESGPLAPPPV